jgi:hypothetical protein
MKAPSKFDYGTAFQAFGAGVSAVGEARQAEAAKAAATYSASVSRANAQIASWRAASILQAGADAEQRQRLRTAQTVGSLRARLAANGVDLTQGSALNLLQDADFVGERDALTIRDNAAKDAWGAKVQETSYLNEAAMSEATADSISPSSAMATSLLSSAGRVASSWYSYSKATK